MASKRARAKAAGSPVGDGQSAGAQPSLPGLDAAPIGQPGPAVDVATLAVQLAAAIAALPDVDAKVAALNQARTALHAASPFTEPIDLVLWERAENVVGYDEYVNPNAVSGPEMRLLRHSMVENGVAMPLVTHREVEAGVKVVVDGMHRRRLGTEDEVLRGRMHGYLPITLVRPGRADVGSRVAATVEFNRARGEHAVDRMSALVRLLYELGWPDEKIQAELGMQADEVLRLKQITGIAALFAQREFSQAWEIDDSEAQRQHPHKRGASGL